jgi:zinc transporter ZupT
MMLSSYPMLFTLSTIMFANLVFGFEFHGEVDLMAGTNYSMNFWKINGDYADSTCKLAIYPLDSTQTMETAENSAESIENNPPTVVAAGGTISPASFETLLQLQFDVDSWLTTFHFNIATSGEYGIFLEHSPDEFTHNNVDDITWLMDQAGNTINVHTDSHTEDEKVNKTTVIIAICVTMIPSIVGIILFADVPSNIMEPALRFIVSITGGVLIGTAVFLLMPETYVLVAEGNSESDTAAKWGTALTCGFVFGYILKMADSYIANNKAYETSVAITEKNGGCVDGSVEVEMKKTKDGSAGSNAVPTILTTTTAMTSMVILGDLLCNFVDGIFVASAFDGCSDSFGWSVVIITILHEFPQEICEFVLITRDGGYTKLQGLIINLAGAIFALFGGLTYLYGKPSNEALGVILAFTAAMFIFCALVELPTLKILKTDSMGDTLANLGLFILGCTIMGLILLDHEHCTVGGSHESHDH